MGIFKVLGLLTYDSTQLFTFSQYLIIMITMHLAGASVSYGHISSLLSIEYGC